MTQHMNPKAKFAIAAMGLIAVAGFAAVALSHAGSQTAAISPAAAPPTVPPAGAPAQNQTAKNPTTCANHATCVVDMRLVERDTFYSMDPPPSRFTLKIIAEEPVIRWICQQCWIYHDNGTKTEWRQDDSYQGGWAKLQLQPATDGLYGIQLDVKVYDYGVGFRHNDA